MHHLRFSVFLTSSQISSSVTDKTVLFRRQFGFTAMAIISALFTTNIHIWYPSDHRLLVASGLLSQITGFVVLINFFLSLRQSGPAGGIPVRSSVRLFIRYGICEHYTTFWKQMNRIQCKLVQVHPRWKGMKRSTLGSGDQRWRPQ